MTTQHTPGPWHLGMKPGPMIYGADSSQVADLRGDLLDKGEALANARLIAAAPDMLKALQLVASIWSSDQTTNIAPDSPLAIVRIAITRATA